MWRLGLHPDLQQEAMLQQRNTYSAQPASVVLPWINSSQEIKDQDHLDDDRSTMLSQREDIPCTVLPVSHDEVDLACSPALYPTYCDTDVSMQLASPASITTLSDEHSMGSTKIIDADEDAKAGASSTPEFKIGRITTRRLRHRRYVSVESSQHMKRACTEPLRARAKTNDGLLLLMTNPAAKEKSAAIHEERVVRKISPTIPIKVLHNQTAKDKPCTKAEPMSPGQFTDQAKGALSLSAEERELEYKHRHTFIGIASLDDFLEVLEISKTHTVSKTAVIKAFVSLAATEQVHVRSHSTEPNGWEVVSRITVDVSSADFMAQAHVKLGSITLGVLLSLIPFHVTGEDEIGALAVLEAFSAASLMDTQAGVGTGSKARAFRSWMIKVEKGD